MKAMKKYKVFLAMLMIFLSVTTTSVFATSTSESGLAIEMKTDETNYDKGDSISVDLSITNKNNFSVELAEAKNIIPTGFKVDNNTNNVLEKTELNIGETIHLKTTFENMNETSLPVVVATGDNTLLLFQLLVFGISVSLFIAIKYKKTRKVLIVFLVASSITSISSYNVLAKQTIEDISVSEKVIYDGKELLLKSVVSYIGNNNSGNDPKEPIVYQDGVKEIELDYKLDEKKKEVLINDSNLILHWKKHEIHILKDKTNHRNDIAIKIESITHLEDGTTIINYSTPSMDEVVKSIDYAGSEMKNGTITPSENVTFIDDTEQYRSATPNLLDVRASEKGSFDMFKKIKYRYNEGGIYFEGVLCLERINYDYQINFGLTGINIKKIYTTLDSNISLDMEIKSDFGGKQKFEMASFEAPIGYGFFAEGKIFAYVSASGEVTFDYEIDVECGFNYSNNNFKGVWDLEGKLNEARANVNLKVGATAEPQVNFLKIGLIGGEFDYGREYELALDVITLKPFEYCLDAGYFNYANVSAILLPGSWNKKFTANLMDEENSHLKENTHYEELGTVEKCTRQYGSLEGTVLKHDGDENVPLYLANVTLEQNGKVRYETKTGSGGVFRFGKEIEKGTYDLYVRSNHYETYKGSIKIIGNKENELDKPIILEPSAESVSVTGKVYNAKSNEPISGATVSVKGYVDRVVTTDVTGNYSLEVPLGNQTIIVSADSYASQSYNGEFNATPQNIDFELTRNYEFEVLEIHAGESYQLDFTSQKRIFLRADDEAEFSSYKDGDLTYHKTMFDSELYRGVKAGSHWEIKVFSGSLTVFANDGGFFEEPDSNLSNYCSYSSMNGVDPIIDHKLSAGDSITLDNQEDLPKSHSYVFHFISDGEVAGTEKVTDYYYSTHFGWDETIDTYELSGNSYWRPLQNLVKAEVTLTSGKATIFYYRLDPLVAY